MPQNCREELNPLRARFVYPSSPPIRRSVRWCARGQVHDPGPEWLKMPRRQFLASRVGLRCSGGRMDLRSRSRWMEGEPHVRTSSGYWTDVGPVAHGKVEDG